MIPKYPSPKRVWYGLYEGNETRSQRRLQDDLGFDQEAAEVILHLRRQVIALQSRLHQVETELTAQSASQQMRLARYRKICDEAIWIELEFQE